MSFDLFDQTKYLEKGLSASWLRNQVIANNIANESTPNFKASSVEFESLFKDALDSQNGGFTAKTTNDKHISFTSSADISPVVVQNTSTTMRQDGNNVDIDYESSELAKNAIWYQTLVEKISSEFNMIEMAIKEGG